MTFDLPNESCAGTYAKGCRNVAKRTNLHIVRRILRRTKSTVNPNYYVLAITVPVFDVQDPSKLLAHFIVGAALFMFDNKRGSYISCLGVVDKGTPGVCMLNGSYFVEPSTSNLLSDPARFRALGIGTFLLSCLQVLGSLAYKSPIVARSDPF
jgi:hypothetical protein